MRLSSRVDRPPCIQSDSFMQTTVRSQLVSHRHFTRLRCETQLAVSRCDATRCDATRRDETRRTAAARADRQIRLTLHARLMSTCMSTKLRDRKSLESINDIYSTTLTLHACPVSLLRLLTLLDSTQLPECCFLFLLGTDSSIRRGATDRRICLNARQPRCTVISWIQDGIAGARATRNDGETERRQRIAHLGSRVEAGSRECVGGSRGCACERERKEGVCIGLVARRSRSLN